jgi:ribosomal protein L37AE/L43A
MGDTISIGRKDESNEDEIYAMFYCCPNCNSLDVLRRHNYCPNCGKKFLWEHGE